MKTKVTSLLLMFIALMIHAQYERKEITPSKNVFDKEQAKEMLGLGKSTIQGVAVAREYTNANVGKNPLNRLVGSDITGTKHLAPEGTVVMLFPMTPYFQEYLKMRERYKQSRKFTPVLSPEAFSYRLEAKVGKSGEFTFPQMKPGKYYVETYFKYVGTGIDYQEVGRTHYYNGFGYMGSSPILQGFNYNYLEGKVESKIITIKEDGSTEKIRL